MTVAKEIKKQIGLLVAYLVENGIAIDQNFPVFRELGDGQSEVVDSSASHARLLKDIVYKELYTVLRRERVYSVLMLDGAMLQIRYQFLGDKLQRSRLAFFPSPFVYSFGEGPELYASDALYANSLDQNAVPCPLRFDFDDRAGVWREGEHPKSHLTLGQYKECRIPLSHPVGPDHFIDFILRHFYADLLSRSPELPIFKMAFTGCITQEEKAMLYLSVPSRA